ncbi:unnamed protein product [Vitrella brassicaformis CCMP3155]|uniref:WW domain-containing protein n=1 Tax=Vitrella brassicaformis (strain CCMP3155) TaxID=1169540 RepID=A0A0G4FQP7_VITBC|nr:unnamed protein product [Vitrella brassicaformis CCMP3155]|eukprot:CEM16775.1 unnamed protein product [Vitrella brassicaformis CCMP3155]
MLSLESPDHQPEASAPTPTLSLAGLAERSSGGSAPSDSFRPKRVTVGSPKVVPPTLEGLLPERALKGRPSTLSPSEREPLTVSTAGSPSPRKGVRLSLGRSGSDIGAGTSEVVSPSSQHGGAFPFVDSSGHSDLDAMRRAITSVLSRQASGASHGGLSQSFTSSQEESAASRRESAASASGAANEEIVTAAKIGAQLLNENEQLRQQVRRLSIQASRQRMSVSKQQQSIEELQEEVDRLQKQLRNANEVGRCQNLRELSNTMDTEEYKKLQERYEEKDAELAAVKRQVNEHKRGEENAKRKNTELQQDIADLSSSPALPGMSTDHMLSLESPDYQPEASAPTPTLSLAGLAERSSGGAITSVLSRQASGASHGGLSQSFTSSQEESAASRRESAASASGAANEEIVTAAKIGAQLLNENEQLRQQVCRLSIHASRQRMSVSKQQQSIEELQEEVDRLQKQLRNANEVGRCQNLRELSNPIEEEVDIEQRRRVQISDLQTQAGEEGIRREWISRDAAPPTERFQPPDIPPGHAPPTTTAPPHRSPQHQHFIPMPPLALAYVPPVVAQPAGEESNEGDGVPSSSSSPSTAPLPLPAGWTEYFTNDGRPYYHKAATGVTTWFRPSFATEAAEFLRHHCRPEAWTEYFTNDGRRYYHNAATGVTTWDRPTCFPPPPLPHIAPRPHAPRVAAHGDGAEVVIGYHVRTDTKVSDGRGGWRVVATTPHIPPVRVLLWRTRREGRERWPRGRGREG